MSTKKNGLIRGVGGRITLITVAIALVAVAAVKLFVAWLTRHGMAPFGVYRILLAAAVYLYFLL